MSSHEVAQELSKGHSRLRLTAFAVVGTLHGGHDKPGRRVAARMMVVPAGGGEFLAAVGSRRPDNHQFLGRTICPCLAAITMRPLLLPLRRRYLQCHIIDERVEPVAAEGAKATNSTRPRRTGHLRSTHLRFRATDLTTPQAR